MTIGTVGVRLVFEPLSANCWSSLTIETYRVAQKSKPLPNYQKIVLNCIRACQWD